MAVRVFELRGTPTPNRPLPIPDCHVQAGLRKTISLDMYSAAPNSTAAQAAVAMLVTAARAAQAQYEHMLAEGEAGTPLRLTRPTIHPLWEGLGKDLGLAGRLNRTLVAMKATQASSAQTCHAIGRAGWAGSGCC